MESKRDIENVPNAGEIRAALDRIVASPAFAQSPQLAAFLRFVVEAVLTGKSDYIKSYTIAVEALGRNESFDPARDPIVRVEAGRLRKALARYFGGVGADRAIIIELPLGSYVPLFRRRKISRRAVRLAAVLIRHLSGRLGAASLAAGLLVLAAFCAGALLVPDRTTTTREPMTAATVGSVLARFGMPVVFIEAFDAPGAPAEATVALEGLPRKLRDALARFDEIEVASEIATPAGPSLRAGAQASARREYRLAATLEYRDGRAEALSFDLHDVLDGTVAWSRTFENNRPADEWKAAESEIVRKVATTLAQPYGVIYARELGKVGPGNGNGHYRCLLDAIEFQRNDDSAANERIRACLDQATTSDPTFAAGFAMLALLAVHEYYDDLGNDPAILERALRAALRAAALRPESARAHQALMNVLFARGEITAALAQGEQAVLLNRYDMTVLTSYGMRVAASGDLQKGAALLRQAAADTPVRPPILDFALFLSAYLLGDDASATHHAGLLASESHPLALLARALAAVRAGDRERARQAAERIFAPHPAWRNDARKRLERLIPSPAIVERVSRDLATLGMGG